MPHSPPQKSGLYISGDFKETGALTPRVALTPNQNSAWPKRTTATAPITPAAKQIATRWQGNHRREDKAPFYVCCTRAMKDLIVGLFTGDIAGAQRQIRSLGLFPEESMHLENEIARL